MLLQNLALPVALFGPALPLGKPGNYRSSSSPVPAFNSACLGQPAVSATQKSQATVLEMQPALVEREMAILTRAGERTRMDVCCASQHSELHKVIANELFSEGIFSLGHVLQNCSPILDKVLHFNVFSFLFHFVSIPFFFLFFKNMLSFN